MTLDAATVARWIEPLAREPGEIADIFVERRQEALLLWRDGEILEARLAATESLSARWQRGTAQRLACVSRADEAGLREAIRELGRSSLPIRPPRDSPPTQRSHPRADHWRRRLTPLFARVAPLHDFRCRLADVERSVFPARGAPVSHVRALVSLEGTFRAASRRGDEIRRFSFHGPDSDAVEGELKAALGRAAEPREAPVPCPEGPADAVLANGSAVVLFHEILSHPLESGTVSPLSGLAQARVAVPDLEVRDDAARLDLFGGYESDDEGVSPRSVKLLDAGRLASRLTGRASAARSGRDPSNGHGRRAEAGDPPLPRGSNLIVEAGNATREEMARRLTQGLWIEDLDSGSVELSSGTFRLRFPRARRVRRGQLTDELGPGILAGEILPALKGVETGLGRESRAYRALGWCAGKGQIVAVQGAAPDVLIRGLSVGSLP